MLLLFFINLKKFISNKFFTFLILTLVLTFVVVNIINIFQEQLSFWEKAVLLERKHLLKDDYFLNFPLELIYRLIEWFEKLMLFLERNLNFPVGFLILNLWFTKNIYLLLTMPVILLISFFWIISKKLIIKLLLLLSFLYIFIPIPYAISQSNDFVISKTGFNLLLPWSKDYIWIWSSNSDVQIPYTVFEYNWNQKNLSKKAVIKVSCLGRYQLLVNDASVYHGPSFSSLPIIYYDSIEFSKYINQGDNSIKIYCNFINTPVHEYPNYPEPGLLIGGYIEDGIFNYTLSDHNLWRAGGVKGYKNYKKIFDSGYSELIDLTSLNNPFSNSIKKDFPNYLPEVRPLSLLKSEVETLKPKYNNIYDLGRFKVGYITFITNYDSKCISKLKWTVDLSKGKDTESNIDQEDLVTFPKGNYKWQQFSRRAGRYIILESNCKGSQQLEFESVGRDLEFSKINLIDQLDRQILELSKNTLLNNVQDQFEDSVDRERALYIGDGLAFSKCLISYDQNKGLIKETIRQIALSQKEDGSFPSIIHSGKDQFIPVYHFQWIPLLNLYLKMSNDFAFTQEMYPYLVKALEWEEKHKSDLGFIYNKNQEEWWNFIDWSPNYSDSYSYSTILQIWYLKNLADGAEILKTMNLSNEKLSKDYVLTKEMLLKYGFDIDQAIFVDSFDEKNKSKSTLITNSLAAKFGLFPSFDVRDKALDYFSPDFYLQSPYSQTWVVDWLLIAGKKEIAEDVIRGYWGSMINKGYTSSPEVYNPNNPFILSAVSYSHGWGCGPVYLYDVMKSGRNQLLLNY